MSISTTLDTAGAADRISVAEKTMEKWRCQGGGPKFAKLGRKVVYRITDLDDFVASRIVSSTSQKIAA